MVDRSRRLVKTYGTNRWGAVSEFFTASVPWGSLFDGAFWSRVWATYAMYDPSYINDQSYGFFVDVSNGWATVVPSLMWLVSMTTTIPGLSARALGIMGMIKFYTEFHGAPPICLDFIIFSPPTLLKHDNRGIYCSPQEPAFISRVSFTTSATEASRVVRSPCLSPSPMACGLSFPCSACSRPSH